MYVKESLRLNKFQNVAIPTNREYFARVGNQQVPEEQYTGEEGEIIPTGMSKVEEIEAYRKYCEEQERKAQETEENNE